MSRVAVNRARRSGSGATFRPAPLVQRKCGCAGPCACGAQASRAAPPVAAGGSGRALPEPLRRGLEPLFQTSFARVRVHDDARSRASAAALGARAYTVAQDIHFAADQFHPERPAGLRLLAHELGHTIQQDGAGPAGDADSLRVGDPASPLEREADAAADRVAAGRPARIVGRVAAGDGLVQRDGPGDAGEAAAPAAAPRVVPPVAPTDEQAEIIENARRAAAVRTQIAMFRTRGIAPDERTGESYRREAERLARIMFDWPRPNMEQVDEIVSGMAARLVGPSVMVAGENDPECGSRAGYVRGFRPPIVLCPAFFSPESSEEQQTRTLVHESAHLMRIGSASVGEGYCVYFTCDSSCPGGFDSADSWAQYVHCLSGQTPDEPEHVEGEAQRGSSEAPSP